MALYDNMKEFVKAIKVTKEFNDLILYKNQIEKNPALKRQLIDFNKRVSEVYSSKKPPNAVTAEANELKKKFDDLAKIPEIDKYILASKKFNEMMLKTNKQIDESLQNDLKLR